MGLRPRIKIHDRNAEDDGIQSRERQERLKGIKRADHVALKSTHQVLYLIVYNRIKGRECTGIGNEDVEFANFVSDRLEG